VCSPQQVRHGIAHDSLWVAAPVAGTCGEGRWKGDPSAPTVDALLARRRERLRRTGTGGGRGPDDSASHNGGANSWNDLAGREYLGLKKPSVKDQIMERLTNWLNEFLARWGAMEAVSVVGAALLACCCWILLGWMAWCDRARSGYCCSELVSAVGALPARNGRCG